jgi:hypothetical protein
MELKLPSINGLLPGLALRRSWHYELVPDDR